MDRMPGFGLKYPAAFKDTDMRRVRTPLSGNHFTADAGGHPASFLASPAIYTATGRDGDDRIRDALKTDSAFDETGWPFTHRPPAAGRETQLWTVVR
jgi:hypothetical protein